MRYKLTGNEWAAIKPMLPNKPRRVPRVNDRRILNGIFWVLRSGAPWRDLPQELAPIPLAITASAPTSTVHATWLNGSSIRSGTAGGSQHAMTS